MDEINKEADSIKEAIHQRTGLQGSDLVCPREKSEMTPCVARDGSLAVTDDGKCVGCLTYLKDISR